MTRWTTLLTMAAAISLFSCMGPGGAHDHPGDVEVRGWSTGTWDGHGPARPENFALQYETTAWRGMGANAFHRMRTEVTLAYDPMSGMISNARIESSKPGRAYRHVCLAPNGPILHVRITTLFDDRGEDLTVVKVHDVAPAVDACDIVGVGPDYGLVESFDVLFDEDGSYRVLAGTKAYLNEADIRVERTMNEGTDRAKTIRASFP